VREICVVDRSVSIGWLFDEQADQYTEATLQALTQSSAITPRWWLVETLNVLLALERRERLAVGKAVEALRLLLQLPVQLRDTQTSIFELHALANRHRLTSYDALYLDMALATGLPLATRDEALRQAATESGVGVWQA
jgi:predicted nucleic acid-binding protein